jgi:hypothetical protein
MDNNTPKVDVNDFGFVSLSEEDIKNETNLTISTLNGKLEETQLKLVKMKKLIWPLLENLKRDPHKEIIKWPDRTEPLNKLMRDIDALLQ